MTNDLQQPKGTTDQEPHAAAHRSQRSTIQEGFRNRTKGERLFNRLAYTGVGFFGVTGVSVLMTWLLRDNPKTSPKFEAFVERNIERFNLHRFRNTINSNVTIATLFLGGTIVSVLPIKWLEDSKASIVKKFDERFYSKKELQENPAIEAAHREMESLPKQTWASVLGSRLVAFAATFGVSFLMGSNESPIAKRTGESIDKRSAQFGRWMDRALNKGNPKAIEEIEKAVISNKDAIESGALKGIEIVRKEAANLDRIPTRIWNYIGMDGFYTVITSATLFAFTRILAPVLGKKQLEPEQRQPAPSRVEAIHPQLQDGRTAADETRHETPHPLVTQTTHHQRLAEHPAQEITA